LKLALRPPTFNKETFSHAKTLIIPPVLSRYTTEGFFVNRVGLNMTGGLIRFVVVVNTNLYGLLANVIQETEELCNFTSGNHHNVVKSQRIFYMTISKRITEERIASGLSQEELAKRIGVTQPTIGHIESGRTKRISYDMIEKIAAALNISPTKLTGNVEATDFTVIRDIASEYRSTKNTLILDPKTDRKIILEAPYTITRKEWERIRSWLEVQLNIEDL
jgi:transcriptional regulator with XRE-family HTH domain